MGSRNLSLVAIFWKFILPITMILLLLNCGRKILPEDIVQKKNLENTTWKLFAYLNVQDSILKTNDIGDIFINFQNNGIFRSYGLNLFDCQGEYFVYKDYGIKINIEIPNGKDWHIPENQKRQIFRNMLRHTYQYNINNQTLKLYSKTELHIYDSISNRHTYNYFIITYKKVSD